jgi:hypothetical protein
MTANKDSPENVKFMRLFGKIKNWSEDDPKSLPALASEDESIKALCLELLLAAGSIQKNERSDRELFTAPVDSKFVSAWRDFEKRYAHVLLIVRSNAVEAGDAHLILSFDCYEQPPRWDDADWEAARAAELIERTIYFAHSQADGDMTGASTTEPLNGVYLNPEALSQEAKAVTAEFRAAYAAHEMVGNKLLAKAKQGLRRGDLQGTSRAGSECSRGSFGRT